MEKIASIEEYRDITYAAVDEYNRRDFEGAVAKFERLQEANPDNAKLHELLAVLYLKLGRLEDAEREIEACRQLFAAAHPEAPFPARRGFAELVEEAGDAEVLEAGFFEMMAREEAPDLVRDLDAAARLGIARMGRGEYEKAEAVLCGFRERVLAHSATVAS